MVSSMIQLDYHEHHLYRNSQKNEKLRKILAKRKRKLIGNGDLREEDLISPLITIKIQL